MTVVKASHLLRGTKFACVCLRVHSPQKESFQMIFYNHFSANCTLFDIHCVHLLCVRDHMHIRRTCLHPKIKLCINRESEHKDGDAKELRLLLVTNRCAVSGLYGTCARLTLRGKFTECLKAADNHTSFSWHAGGNTGTRRLMHCSTYVCSVYRAYRAADTVWVAVSFPSIRSVPRCSEREDS